MSSCPSAVSVAPLPSSRPPRPCASRFFQCDTDSFPDSVPVQEPKSLPNVFTHNSSQIVPRPTAGLSSHTCISSSVDVALLGEPSLIFSHTEVRQYLPSIGDLLPAKQKAPVNNPGESPFFQIETTKNSIVNAVPSGTHTKHESSCPIKSIDNQL